MISTLHDNVYRTTEQTQDRIVKVTATTNSGSGQIVYFRTRDPDDRSSYETNNTDNDNHDATFRRGNLGSATGFTEAPGTRKTDGNGRVIRIGIRTNAQGKAAVNLTVTNRYAGDNYIVDASCGDSTFTEKKSSGLLVAWKRIYIEEDQMYQFGTDLTADFNADADNNPDNISVRSTNGINVGDTLTLFDANSPNGEGIVVRGIAGNTLTVVSAADSNRDIQSNYDAEYPRANGRGAAVADPRRGVYDADVTGRTDNAFGGRADGSDGGCFVEVSILADGGNRVPYRRDWTGGVSRADYTDVWFKNRGDVNYIHVVGCAYNQVGDNVYGVSHAGNNYNYIFLEEIQDDFAANAPTVNADTDAHEIGHHFNLANTDNAHPAGVWCHEGNGTDYCLMSYQRDRTDGVTEFCHSAPNHLDEVRDENDSL